MTPVAEGRAFRTRTVPSPYGEGTQTYVLQLGSAREHSLFMLSRTQQMTLRQFRRGAHSARAPYPCLSAGYGLSTNITALRRALVSWRRSSQTARGAYHALVTCQLNYAGMVDLKEFEGFRREAFLRKICSKYWRRPWQPNYRLPGGDSRTALAFVSFFLPSPPTLRLARGGHVGDMVAKHACRGEGLRSQPR